MAQKNLKKVARDVKPAHTTSQRLEWWILLALASVAFAAFARTIPYAFVFDDEFQILRNTWIRNLSGVKLIFISNVWQFMNPSTISNYYRPFHMLLHMLGYQISGLQPHAYHIINILFHCICTIFVAVIGYRLTGRKWICVAAALIFGLHPIHAESVAWIAAVPDPSCAAFYFAAFYLYLRDHENPERLRFIIASLFFLLLALLSKEMALTFPLVVIAADWLLHKKLRWSRYAMIAGVFALYIALRLNALGSLAQGARLVKLSLAEKFLSTIVFAGNYILKLFIPHDINAFHVFNPTTSLYSPEFLPASLVLAAYGFGMWWLRRDRIALFLFCFSLLTLAPVLDIRRLGENAFADRYLYIPSFGSSILIPLIASKIWGIKPKGVRIGELQAGICCLAAVLLPYTFLLENTIPMWRNNKMLYSETFKRSPTATLIACNLGSYYHRQGDFEQAKAWYQKAIDVWDKSYAKEKSNLAGAHIGLGGAYLKLGQTKLALENFNIAYRIIPGSPTTLDNLATAYMALGDYDTALRHLQRSISLNPRSERSYNNIAVCYLSQKKLDEAIDMAQKALNIYPKIGESYMIQSRAYALKGMPDQARRCLLAAREVDPTKASLVEKELRNLSQVHQR
jgi:protein O-mannosyl-transferase